MTGQSFAQLERKFQQLAKELDGGSMRDRLDRVGKVSHGDIDAAIRGDLGDSSMSGWRRGRPIEITGTHRVVGDSALFFSAGKASAQMRVLQSGRNQGSSGMAGPGVSADGTTRRTKAGNVVRARARVGRQWNGTTRGKGTWDAAANRLAANVPKRIHKEGVRAAITSAGFKEG